MHTEYWLTHLQRTEQTGRQMYGTATNFKKIVCDFVDQIFLVRNVDRL